MILNQFPIDLIRFCIRIGIRFNQRIELLVEKRTTETLPPPPTVVDDDVERRRQCYSLTAI